PGIVESHLFWFRCGFRKSIGLSVADKLVRPAELKQDRGWRGLSDVARGIEPAEFGYEFLAWRALQLRIIEIPIAERRDTGDQYPGRCAPVYARQNCPTHRAKIVSDEHQSLRVDVGTAREEVE